MSATTALRNVIQTIENTWNQDTVMFHWPKTIGIKHYTLLVRNITNRNHLLISKNFPDKINQYRQRMEGTLRYGQTCEFSVMMTGPNNEITQSQWQIFTIGGEEVPRNPTAAINTECPERSIKIIWVPSVKRPEYYSIKAIPARGKIITQTCQQSPYTYHGLKTNTSYVFKISGIFLENDGTIKEGHGSKTDAVSTYPKQRAMPETQIGKVLSSVVNTHNPFTQNNHRNTDTRTKDFDKPKIDIIIVDNEDGPDRACISWEQPDFDGDSDDYKILKYEVKLLQDGVVINNFENLASFDTQTEMFVINFGKYYAVNIKTTYEEIDAEKIRTSEIVRTFYSRPDKPSIKVIKQDGNIFVRWTPVSGADGFQLQIQEVRSGRNIFRREGGQGFNEYKIQSSYFAVGRYYRFSVVAITKDKKTRSNAIDKLIGDQLVPRQAVATLNAAKPYNSVDITWESPEKEPFRYKVISTDGKHSVKHLKTTNCIINGLQSGSRYRFNVIAIFEDGTESDPCSTDEIVTDPRPSNLENLQVKLDKDLPHSSVFASWNSSENATNYKIITKTLSTLWEHITDKNNYMIKHLDSDTEYEINVSPGNTEGYGTPASAIIRTELEPVQHVIVKCNSSNSISVSFAHNHVNVCQYDVSLHNSDSDEVLERKKIEQLDCIFKNLYGNTEYYVSICCTKDDKTSRCVESKKILTVPNKVNDLAVCRSEKGPSLDLEIQWESRDSNINHEIEIQTNNVVERIFQVPSGNFCRYRCMEEGELYSLRIRAMNKTGYGDWSDGIDVQLLESTK